MLTQTETKMSTPGREAASNPVSRFHAALATLMKHHPNMTLAQACTLLSVALYPDRNGVAYEALTGLGQATVSRQLIDMSDSRRLRKGVKTTSTAGLGLIQVKTDPSDSRGKIYSLTLKGKALVTLLGNIIER
jgi:DNA-binding MarR family transcriptional regulator